MPAPPAPPQPRRASIARRCAPNQHTPAVRLRLPRRCPSSSGGVGARDGAKNAWAKRTWWWGALHRCATRRLFLLVVPPRRPLRHGSRRARLCISKHMQFTCLYIRNECNSHAFYIRNEFNSHAFYIRNECISHAFYTRNTCNSHPKHIPFISRHRCAAHLPLSTPLSTEPSPPPPALTPRSLPVPSPLAPHPAPTPLPQPHLSHNPNPLQPLSPQLTLPSSPPPTRAAQLSPFELTAQNAISLSNSHVFCIQFTSKSPACTSRGCCLALPRQASYQRLHLALVLAAQLVTAAH